MVSDPQRKTSMELQEKGFPLCSFGNIPIHDIGENCVAKVCTDGSIDVMRRVAGALIPTNKWPENFSERVLNGVAGKWFQESE